jgi:hypothetical protein
MLPPGGRNWQLIYHNKLMLFFVIPEQGRHSGLEDDAVVLDAERVVIGYVFPMSPEANIINIFTPVIY